MGDYLFKLPDVGEGTAEAEIAAWHVKPGDRVEEDQPLVDLMTDKAVVEMTSPVAGTVVSTHCAVGDKAAVGSTLVVLKLDGAEGSNTAATSDEQAVPAKLISAESTDASHESAPSAGSAAPAFTSGAPASKPLASPAVRRRALEHGIELKFVPARGPSGRIMHEDLDAYIALAGSTNAAGSIAPAPAARTGVEDMKIIGLRRKIAEKMQDAKRRIPHITYVEELDLTELEELRTHLNASKSSEQPKLSLLPFFMRALVRVLPDYPQINARYDDEAGVLHRHAAIHLGIATQTPNGLMVPVVRHAEARDIWDCAIELARIAKAARDGKATREELSGSTITITSLGALGGITATHVINHPEVAIIGPNKLVERPVVRNGQIVVRKMMNLSSSFDHRIVDGYDAAEFVQRLKGLLEHPAAIFIDPPLGSSQR